MQAMIVQKSGSHSVYIHTNQPMTNSAGTNHGQYITINAIIRKSINPPVLVLLQRNGSFLTNYVKKEDFVTRDLRCYELTKHVFFLLGIEDPITRIGLMDLMDDSEALFYIIVTRCTVMYIHFLVIQNLFYSAIR